MIQATGLSYAELKNLTQQFKTLKLQIINDFTCKKQTKNATYFTLEKSVITKN